MSRSYNKKVKPCDFQLGDLILRENPKNQPQWVQKGNLKPKWLGKYIIMKVFGSGAYHLSIVEG